MRVQYPYTVTRDEDGFWLAKCPDVRGAATDDRNPEVAVTELHDALIAALEGYMERGLPFPAPSVSGNYDGTIVLEGSIVSGAG